MTIMNPINYIHNKSNRGGYMRKTYILALLIAVCLLSFTACGQGETGHKNEQTTGPVAEPSQKTDDELQLDSFDAANAPRSLTHFLKLHEIDITKDRVDDGSDEFHTIIHQYDKDGTLVVTKIVYDDIADEAVGYERYTDGSSKLRYYYEEKNGEFLLDHVRQYNHGDEYPIRIYKYSTSSGYLIAISEYDEPAEHVIKLCNYEDGVLSSYATYTYDKEDRIAEKQVFNSHDEQVAQYVQEFDGAGRIVGLTGYDIDGNVIYRAIANYDDRGNMAYTCIYENEMLTYESRLIYQNGEADHCEYVSYDEAGGVSDKGRLTWVLSEPSWGLNEEREFDRFLY